MAVVGGGAPTGLGSVEGRGTAAGAVVAAEAGTAVGTAALSGVRAELRVEPLEETGGVWRCQVPLR
jgi:hypothetical protein